MRRKDGYIKDGTEKEKERDDGEQKLCFVTLAPSPHLVSADKPLAAWIYQYSVSLTHSLPLPTRNAAEISAPTPSCLTSLPFSSCALKRQAWEHSL
jgi:hypothetical protein